MLTIFQSAQAILKNFDRKSKQVTTLLKYGYGLLAMDIKFIFVLDNTSTEKSFYTADTLELLQEKFSNLNLETEPLAVEMSEKLLDGLKAPPADLYMFNNSPFPVFSRLAFEGPIETSLMGLTKVIDTKDPVSMEEIQFVGVDAWKAFYERLKPICVAACPNGHALSFDTLCNFYREDGWDQEELTKIVKVKCPASRKRFEIHDVVPQLCSVFSYLSEEESERAAEKKTKEDRIQTYFSTIEDESDDEDLEELRMMMRREEEEDETDDQDDMSEDDDYQPEEEDESSDNTD
jgi:hypothetical protein